MPYVTDHATRYKTTYEYRIVEDFCPMCKYQPKDGTVCPYFVYENGVCVQFVYKNQQIKQEYEDMVLDNQASTIWMNRGKPYDIIKEMSRKELRSVLPKQAFIQFELEAAESKKDLEAFIFRQEHPAAIEEQKKAEAVKKRAATKQRKKKEAEAEIEAAEKRAEMRKKSAKNVKKPKEPAKQQSEAVITAKASAVQEPVKQTIESPPVKAIEAKQQKSEFISLWEF